MVPISSTGIRGQGQNSLFEIKSPIPEVVLSSPYNTLPYKYLVTTNSQVDFTGLISTDTLLIAGLFLNGFLIEITHILLLSALAASIWIPQYNRNRNNTHPALDCPGCSCVDSSMGSY